MLWIINLTENEIEVLKSVKNEYGSFENGFSYEIQVYNYACLGSNAAKGALSSLVKKGILTHKRVKEDGQILNYYRATPEFLGELNERFMTDEESSSEETIKPVEMTDEEARKYFKDSGLSYKDVGSKEFFSLINILKRSLKEDKQAFEMTVSNKPFNKTPLFKHDENGCLTSGFIYCDGPYFKGREAISFNEDGFIGFAGWADSKNVRPFITAFVEWCDEMKRGAA